MNPMPTAGSPHPLSGEEPPLVFGHEFSGVVEEVGEGVEGLARGDSVVVEPLIVCGECFACQDGRYNLSEKMGFIGLHRALRPRRRAVRAHRRGGAVRAPHRRHAAGPGGPHRTAGGGGPRVRLSGAGNGDVALVGGAGPIGLFTSAVLKALGATVIVSEMSQKRKEKAKNSGVADHVLDPAQDDIVARTMEITGGRGADVGFECAGSGCTSSPGEAVAARTAHQPVPHMPGDRAQCKRSHRETEGAAASSARSATSVYGGHEHTLHQSILALTSGTSPTEHENPGVAPPA